MRGLLPVPRALQPLPRYYEQSRPSPRIVNLLGLAVGAACAFSSVAIAGKGSHVPYESLVELRGAPTSGCPRTVSGRPELIP